MADAGALPIPAKPARKRNVGSLDAAFFAAQQEFEPIIKAGYNAEKGYAHARLGDVLNVIVPTLAKHGISFRQPTDISEDGRFMVVLTTLTHVASGEKWISTYPVCDARELAKVKGATLTYARRYAALAAVGVAPEEVDDDVSRVHEADPEGIDQRPPEEREAIIMGAEKDALVEDWNTRMRAAETIGDLDDIMAEAAEKKTRLAANTWDGLEFVEAQERERINAGTAPKPPEPSPFEEIKAQGLACTEHTRKDDAIVAYAKWLARANSKTLLARCSPEERLAIKALKKSIKHAIDNPQLSAALPSPHTAEEGEPGFSGEATGSPSPLSEQPAET